MNIEGIHCGGCEGRVKRALEALPGVETAVASHVNNNAVITLKAEVADDTLKKAVEDAGFTVLGFQ